MPFQPVNYANIEPQGTPWMRDLMDNLTSGYKAGRLPYETAQEEEKQKLANAMQSLLVQEQPKKFNSDMRNDEFTRALQGANTNKINIMLPSDLTEANLKNKWYEKLTKSQIDSNEAMAALRQMGGSNLGAGGREEILFQNLIKRDNPNLSQDQIYEASNVLRNGGNKLSNGTSLNPLSPASRASFDRLTKYSSTSPLITGNISGAQAEAEINELSKHAQAGLKPYGTTILGYNPSQIVDSFKSDETSQDRLGKFIAAKQLQYEIAQNEIKLANGKPGITSTKELMDLGMQNIKATYPKLSQRARETAQKYFIDGLQKGYEARRKINLGASTSFNQNNNPNSGEKNISNLSTEQLLNMYQGGS